MRRTATISNNDAHHLCRSVLFAIILILIPNTPQAQNITDQNITDNVIINAKKLTYNYKTDLITASGNIIITYKQYTLKTNAITYNRKEKILIAHTNTTLSDSDGNTINAENLVLNDTFSEIIAQKVSAELFNGAQLSAKKIQKKNNQITTFDNATYTRCKTCRVGNIPMWEAKSQKVTHDKKQKRLIHKNAQINIFGVPILWTPYFSHPEPNVKRASGFLFPKISQSNSYGFALGIPYFFNISPNYDLTVTPRFMTKELPILKLKWRHWINLGILGNGKYHIEGSGLYQNDKSQPAPGNKRWRGHFNSEGTININQNWKWGWDATVVSDDTYLKRYKTTKNNDRTAIQNEIYLTNIQQNQYFNSEILHFRRLLQDEATGVAPFLAPRLHYQYLQKAPIISGYLKLETKAYHLQREKPLRLLEQANQAKGVSHLMAKADWNNTLFLGQSGILIQPTLQLRTDIYQNHDHPKQNNADSTQNDIFIRFKPKAALETRWPFIAQKENIKHIFEPIAKIIAAADETKKDIRKISNEDSRIFEFDLPTLFKNDRFSGIDRYDGGIRAAIGGNYSLFWKKNAYMRISIAEALHITGRNSFDLQGGSGARNTLSDTIVNAIIQPWKNTTLSYTGRYRTFKAKAHQLNAQGQIDNIQLNVDYAKFDGAELYGNAEDEEQISFNSTVKINKKWDIFGGMRYDFIQENQLKHHAGIAYHCDCANIKLTYEKDFTSDRDEKAGTTILLSIELITLGSIQFE